VCRRLSESGSGHLKALGWFGRLKATDVSAIFEMEQNLPALSVTDNPDGLAFWAGTIDIAGNPDAIRAVGRMALSDGPVNRQ